MAADFELSYAGFPFVLPSPDVMERVQAWMRVNDRLPFGVPGSQWEDSAKGVGKSPPQWPPEIGLYELYVPTGASWWTAFRGLMSSADVAALTGTGVSSVYYQSGVPFLKIATLRMTSGGGTVNPALYLLPPQPLTGLNGVADLYLVTLVDSRYFAQFFPINTAVIWGGNDTWAQLISLYLTRAIPGAGFTVTPATPDAVYGQPEIDSDLYTWAANVGAITDSILGDVGMVLTHNVFDPLLTTYNAVRWGAANTFATAARSTAARAAGGVLWSGVTDLALQAAMPFGVIVTFPSWGEGYGYIPAFTNALGVGVTDNDPRFHNENDEYGYVDQYEATLASLGAPYSSIAAANSFGIASRAYIRTTAKALRPYGYYTGSPTNAAALQALTDQIARDYYDAQLQNVCETYRGIVPFDGRSALNVVYAYWPEPMTRVWRRPLNEYQSEMHHGFGERQSLGPTQLVQVTGAISGGYYPGVLATGVSGVPVASADVVRIRSSNGDALVGAPFFYLAQRYSTTSAIPTYFASNSQLVVNGTLISGGTVNAVLYSDGTKLQSAANLLISGNSPYIQASAGKWISLGIGSH